MNRFIRSGFHRVSVLMLLLALVMMQLNYCGNYHTVDRVILPEIFAAWFFYRFSISILEMFGKTGEWVKLNSMWFWWMDLKDTTRLFHCAVFPTFRFFWGKLWLEIIIFFHPTKAQFLGSFGLLYHLDTKEMICVQLLALTFMIETKIFLWTIVSTQTTS